MAEKADAIDKEREEIERREEREGEREERERERCPIHCPLSNDQQNDDKMTSVRHHHTEKTSSCLLLNIFATIIQVRGPKVMQHH